MTVKEAFDHLKSLGPEKGAKELSRVAETFFNLNQQALKDVQDKLNDMPETDKLLLKFGMDNDMIALVGSYGDGGFMAIGSDEGLKKRFYNILKGLYHEKGLTRNEVLKMLDKAEEEEPEYEEKHL